MTPKPILMTRRELTDPFGSDDEEETAEREQNITKPVADANGSLVNGSGTSPNNEKDLFSDLPKPNLVSNLIFSSSYNLSEDYILQFFLCKQ